MKADPKTAHDVTKAFDEFREAYRQRDVKTLTGLLSPDADVMLVGTGADELRVGVDGIRTQAERDWDQTDAAAMHVTPREVSASGNVAWLTALGEFHVTADGGEARVPIRVTAVLEHRERRWLIAQMHFSAPLAEQPDGRSFPEA